MRQIASAPPGAPYKVLQIGDTSPADELAAVAEYPFLSHMIAEIFSAQADPVDTRIRWFQKEIIENGHFLVTSPRTGEKIPSADSVILPDRTIFYRFRDEPDFLLGSCNLGRGYPITAVVFLAGRLLIQFGDPLWGVAAHHLAQLETILDSRHLRAITTAKEIRLFTGDPNFAHHIWNQLGALESLSRLANPLANPLTNPLTKPGLPLTIQATFTPLGPLAALFPDLRRYDIAWSPSAIDPEENAPGRIHVNLGGALVTTKVQKRVRMAALRQSVKTTRVEAARLVRKHFPIVWISVRSRNRTAENQTEAIVGLCRRLFETYPRCAIILDGYSTPFDLATNANYHTAESSLQIASDAAEAAKIERALSDSGLPGKRQRLTLAIGLPVLDSILLAATTSFAFCHHGTVQHKIGWTTQTPSVVHANRRAIAPGPGPWVSAQIEHPPAVTYISETLVEDVEAVDSDDAEMASRLFENYRFTDIPALVDFVCETMKASLRTRRPSRICAALMPIVLRIPDLWPFFERLKRHRRIKRS